MPPAPGASPQEEEPDLGDGLPGMDTEPAPSIEPGQPKVGEPGATEAPIASGEADEPDMELSPDVRGATPQP